LQFHKNYDLKKKLECSCVKKTFSSHLLFIATYSVKQHTKMVANDFFIIVCFDFILFLTNLKTFAFNTKQIINSDTGSGG
jgi:hypothetical protein